MRWSPLLLVALVACAQSFVPGSEPEAPPDVEPDPVDPPDPAHVTPPPISGGHMLLLDGVALVADPDRDRVHVLDLETATARSIVLQPGDEPGRLVDDATGRVHVALRSGGAVVTLAPGSFGIERRRAVCAHPRGIDYDPVADQVWVACAGGELVRMGARDGAPVATFIEHDLRDVVATGDRLFVSVFRSAALLEVRDGAVVSRRAPPVTNHHMITREGDLIGTFSPNVAWRIRPDGAGGVWMLHQSSMEETVNVSEEGYSLLDVECETGLVANVVTHFPATGAPTSRRIRSPGLAVDFDVADEGMIVAMATEVAESTGRGMGISVEPGSRLYTASQLESDTGSCLPEAEVVLPSGQITAVGYRDGITYGWDRVDARLIRDAARLPPPTIWVHGQPDVTDPGHDLFHLSTGAMMACATCHPEGREDGHTWDFADVIRRTQTLTGGILGTEPFHWSGDQADMRAIMDETFSRRMSARMLHDTDITQIGTWLDTLPEVAAAPRDSAAAARGEAAFASEGCVDCHAGPRFTDNANRDVGTGGSFQVPSLLGLAVRGPWMHDGCAESLAEVLDGCDGAPHGDVTSAATRADLVAYLESL